MPRPTTIEDPDGLAVNIRSFTLALQSRNAAATTIRTYIDSSNLFERFLRESGRPTNVRGIQKSDVEAFIIDQLSRHKPTTANVRYRAVQALFKFLAEDEIIETNPMSTMKPPRLPEKIVPVLSEDQLKTLLRACSGRNWEDRRDLAILSIFIDTGARLAEITALRWSTDPLINDVDLTGGQIRVIGKNDRERMLAIGPTTARALDRWIRERNRRPQVGLDDLWLGRRGRMTTSGLTAVVKRRAKMAGIDNLHPHMFRHTFAHHWLAGGGNETDLMRLAGWQSRTMLQRYGSSAGADRAIQAHRKHGLVDRL